MATSIIDIKEVEISGEALSSFISGFPEYLSDIAYTALATHNIDSPAPGKWYNFSNYLQLLKEIGSTYGDDTIYAIGKATLHCAVIPKNLKTLKDAIDKLEDSFLLNHRNMKICWVTLQKYDLAGKRVELFIENPYPFQLNRGILTCLAREFNPVKDKIPEVSIDLANSVLTKGKYIITW